jgi:hypothetical protein
LTIIFNSWTIVKIYDDFWRDEIRDMQNISRIFRILRISNFNSIQSSNIMTIVLNFFINREAITKIRRRISEITLSIRRISTIEDFISTLIHIRTFTIEIFKNFIINNSSFRNRLKELNSSMTFKILQRS